MKVLLFFTTSKTIQLIKLDFLISILVVRMPFT
jgi:hypothetical protein